MRARIYTLGEYGEYKEKVVATISEGNVPELKTLLENHEHRDFLFQFSRMSEHMKPPPLILAGNHAEMVGYLITEKCQSVSSKVGQTSSTPLLEAMKYKYIDVIKAMLEGDPKSVWSLKITDYIEKDIDILSIVLPYLKEHNTEAKWQEIVTALKEKAIQQANIDMLKLLKLQFLEKHQGDILQQKALLQQEAFLQQALWYLVDFHEQPSISYDDYIALIEYLIENNSNNINKPTAENKLWLVEVIRANHFLCDRIMKEVGGIDLNAADRKGVTPVMALVDRISKGELTKSRVKDFKALVTDLIDDRDLEIDLPTKQGTVFHRVIRSDNVDVANVVLSFKTPKTFGIKDGNGHTLSRVAETRPMEALLEKHEKEQAQHAKDQALIVSQAIAELISTNNQSAFESLFEKHIGIIGPGGTLKQTSIGEDTPLLVLVENHGGMVRFLLRRGMEFDQGYFDTPTHGDRGLWTTPFKQAVFRGYTNTVRVMLKEATSKVAKAKRQAVVDSLSTIDFIRNAEMTFLLLPHLKEFALNSLENYTENRTAWNLINALINKQKTLKVTLQEYQNLKTFADTCRSGEIEVMRTCLIKGISASAKLIDEERTPIQIAAKNGDVAMLQLLEEFGVVMTEALALTAGKSNSSARKTFIANYYNTLTDDSLFLATLLEKGGNTIKANITDLQISYLLERFKGRFDNLVANKRALIHYAVTCPRLLSKLIGSELIDQVNINILDTDENTALHRTLFHNCYESIVLLMQVGANTLIKNTLGELPLHYLPYLKQQQHVDADDYMALIRYLAPNGASDINELFSAGDNLLLVEMIKKKNRLYAGVMTIEGVVLDIADGSGLTPLMAVAQYYHQPHYLKPLLDKGATLEFKTQLGCVVHVVINDENCDILEYFLEHNKNNAIFSIEDEAGKTPLCLAAAEDLLGMVELLRKHGAPPIASTMGTTKKIPSQCTENPTLKEFLENWEQEYAAQQTATVSDINQQKMIYLEQKNSRLQKTMATLTIAVVNLTSTVASLTTAAASDKTTITTQQQEIAALKKQLAVLQAQVAESQSSHTAQTSAEASDPQPMSSVSLTKFQPTH